MLESANKLPQGLPESCVITNLINNEGINAATEATLNLQKIPIEEFHEKYVHINYVDDNSFGSDIQNLDILK